MVQNNTTKAARPTREKEARNNIRYNQLAVIPSTAPQRRRTDESELGASGSTARSKIGNRKVTVLAIAVFIILINTARSEQLGIFGEMIGDANSKECEPVKTEAARIMFERKIKKKTETRMAANRPKSYEDIIKAYRASERAVSEIYGEQFKNCNGISQLIENDSSLVRLANEMVGEGHFAYVAKDWSNTTLSTIVERTCTSTPDCIHWFGAVTCECDDQGFGGALVEILSPPNQLLEEEMAHAAAEREVNSRNREREKHLRNQTDQEASDQLSYGNRDAGPGGAPD